MVPEIPEIPEILEAFLVCHSLHIFLYFGTGSFLSLYLLELKDSNERLRLAIR
jgi:hypothetical protein